MVVRSTRRANIPTTGSSRLARKYPELAIEVYSSIPRDTVSHEIDSDLAVCSVTAAPCTLPQMVRPPPGHEHPNDGAVDSDRSGHARRHRCSTRTAAAATNAVVRTTLSSGNAFTPRTSAFA